MMNKYLEELQDVTTQYHRGLRSLDEAYDGFADILREVAQDSNIDTCEYRELVRYTHMAV